VGVAVTTGGVTLARAGGTALNARAVSTLIGDLALGCRETDIGVWMTTIWLWLICHNHQPPAIPVITSNMTTPIRIRLHTVKSFAQYASSESSSIFAPYYVFVIYRLYNIFGIPATFPVFQFFSTVH
jgi:hypothetical protein